LFLQNSAVYTNGMKNLIGIFIVLIIIIAGAFIWHRMQTDNTAGGDQANSAMLSGGEDVAIAEETVSYTSGVAGFYARPEAEGGYPGVVMIHEWWGLNDNIKDMARDLARKGYQVLAVDLYGEVATTRERAGELTGSLDQAEATANMKAAANYLRERGAERMASLGWCFGGKQSLELALSGEKLDGTVIYYGQLVTDPQRLSAITWPVLGIFGAEDTSIPVANVQAFEAGLNEANVKNSIHIYPGVGHAFANPSGMNYAPEPTRDAWEKTLTFLDENLK